MARADETCRVFAIGVLANRGLCEKHKKDEGGARAYVEVGSVLVFLCTSHTIFSKHRRSDRDAFLMFVFAMLTLF